MAIAISDRCRSFVSAVRTWPVWGKLAAVNIGIFIALRLIAAGMNVWGHSSDIDQVVTALMLQAGFSEWLYRPWGILTYMFTQYDAVHLLVNVLWLVIIGRLCSSIFPHRRTLLLYVIGGLAGGFLFVAVCALSGAPAGTLLAGASASVMAMMGAVAVTEPNRQVTLPMFGAIRLKWIMTVGVLLFAVSQLPGNPLSLAAHAGGFAAGIVAGIVLRPKKAHSINHGRKLSAADDSLDDLLDKVRRSGYGSLTESERFRLFILSKNINAK